MKKMIFLLSLVLSITLFPLCGKGQVVTNTTATTTTVVTNPLPDRLPIGGTNQFYDWIVTNQMFGDCSVSVQFDYTTTNGYKTWRQINWPQAFQSFAEFQGVMAQKSWNLFTQLHGQMDNTDRVFVTWIVSYVNLNSPWPFWVNNFDIGPANSVTAESFKWLMPEPDHNQAIFQMAILKVQGLDRFSVQVDSYPSYFYSWPDSVQSVVSSYPQDFTGLLTNLIILNDWYSFGQYRARFTVGANGATGTYTQNGTLLKSPVVKVVSPSMVRMTITQGSDTTLQESTDLATWTTVRVVGWDESSTNAVIDVPVYPTDHAFFRAWSE